MLVHNVYETHLPFLGVIAQEFLRLFLITNTEIILFTISRRIEGGKTFLLSLEMLIELGEGVRMVQSKPNVVEICWPNLEKLAMTAGMRC